MQPISKSFHQMLLSFNNRFYETPDMYSPLDDYVKIVKKHMLKFRTPIDQNGFWFYVKNEDNLPKQGWKIHISANLENSSQILDIVSFYCLKNKISFKFIVDKTMLLLINGKLINRGSAGKFITIYPKDNQGFKLILKDLYKELSGFEGPYILSDKRYKDSKVIYYRYGGIARKTIINYRGEEEYVIDSPDGNIVIDKRLPYWNPPYWINDIIEIEDNRSIEQNQDTIILHKKYKIIDAIEFSADGGVYIANEISSNKKVIIKEARPFTALDNKNIDAIERLKNEFEKLNYCKHLNITPKPIDFFYEWENAFLVEEFIEGKTLNVFLRDKNPLLVGPDVKTQSYESDKFSNTIETIWKEITRIIEKFHENNLILQDISLRNIIVNEFDNNLKLTFVDLESSYFSNSEHYEIKTPGFYSKAETFDSPFKEEIFNLAFIFMATIFPINNLYDLDEKKIFDFIKAFKNDRVLPNYLLELIELILNRKITKPIEIKIFLENHNHGNLTLHSEDSIINRNTYDSLIQDINNLKNSIYEDMTLNRKDRLFPADPMVYYTNSINVAYGSLGVLYVLNRIEKNWNLDLRKALSWTLSKNISFEKYPPNFFTGLSGIAWVLADIGYISEAKMVLNEANRHKLANHSFDLFYGLAGLGMSNLFMYKKTNELQFLYNSIEIADQIIANSIEFNDNSIFWEDIEGYSFLGYGRGPSGIALFLLYIFLETNSKKYYDTGIRALNYDINFLKSPTTDVLSLPKSIDTQNTLSPYLYDGSVGVGTTLLRYYYVSNDKRYLDIIKQIVNDSKRKYTAFPSLMRGLSGLGNFLLDCYMYLGDREFINSANKVYEGIKCFELYNKGNIAFPGEQLFRVSHDYSTGGSGILLFLYRLSNVTTDPYNYNFLLDHFYNRLRCDNEKVILKQDSG